jgi:hypothetical protein
MTDRNDWPEVDQTLARLDDDLFVSWLDHPQDGKHFALVIFYRENLWSKTATVNRKLAKPRPVKARR